MFVGKVVGTVWSTVKWNGMTGHKLLLVRPYHLADLFSHPKASATEDRETAETTVLPSSVACSDPPRAIQTEAVVCIDLLDAGIGDDVVVAFGHAARVAANPVDPNAAKSVSPMTTPIDAAVVAVVDGFHIVRPST